jgi:hypothetical protein
MKLSYVIFVLPFVVGSIPVFADRMIAFYFSPSTGTSCNDNEKALLGPIFNISNYKNRRHLRSFKDNATDADMDDRGLTVNECKNRCLGYAGGWCHPMAVCNIKRRTLQDDFNPLYATCSNHIEEVNARLDALIATSTELSEGCKELLRVDNRNATCEDGILIGEISGFSVQTKIQRAIECVGMPPYSCRIFHSPTPISVQSNHQDVTVTADGNLMYTNVQIHLIPCLSTLDFSIVGPKFSRTRSLDMVSGGSLDVFLLPDFKVLPPGTYNVTAIPNKNLRKAKSFTMTITK